jgi:outer membrane lipoprotein-sorting protein
LWIERPSRFRQDLLTPRASTTLASGNDLWIHFPEAKEVQHVDLARGVKGKEGTSLDSVMPWLTFDLKALEAKYTVKAKKIAVPKGMALRVYPKDSNADVKDIEPQTPSACYRIDFAPTDPTTAPGLSLLSLWVDGVNPWPLKFERESTDESIQTTEFGNILLEGPIDAKIFEFKAPRGTKTVELSG